MPAFARITLFTSNVPVRADLQACHDCCSALLDFLFVYLFSVTYPEDYDFFIKKCVDYSIVRKAILAKASKLALEDRVDVSFC